MYLSRGNSSGTMRKQGSHFALKTTGRFQVETPGSYGFATQFAGGIQILIDGEMVLDDPNGREGFSPRHVNVEIGEGTHTIEARYLQLGNETRIDLMVGPPSSYFRLLDQTWLAQVPEFAVEGGIHSPGEFFVLGDGEFIFLPHHGFEGELGFSYGVVDENGNPAQGQARIRVLPDTLTLDRTRPGALAGGDNQLITSALADRINLADQLGTGGGQLVTDGDIDLSAPSIDALISAMGSFMANPLSGEGGVSSHFGRGDSPSLVVAHPLS